MVTASTTRATNVITRSLSAHAEATVTVGTGGSGLLLAGMGLAVSYAVLQNGGAERLEWRISTAGLALLAMAYWLFSSSSERAPAPPKAVLWPAVLLPCYAAFQFLPMPLPALRVFSPQAAHVIESASAVLKPVWFASLSIVPVETLQHALRFAACALVFLLVREACWRSGNHRWRPVLPLMLLGTLEAVLGLAQYYTARSVAHGTYVNRNHYAGVLEMILPFAAVYPFAALYEARSRWHSPVRPAALACAGIAAALLMLLGIVHSLSRMGFIAALFSLFVSGVGILVWGLPGRGREGKPVLRGAGALACLVLVLCGFLFLAPSDLIERFGRLSVADPAGRTERIELWKETLPVIRAYPVFGCGLGCYESGFMRYKKSWPLVTDDFAHNDYLQYLAELGVVGFVAAGTLVAGVLIGAIRAAKRHASPGGRAMAVACLASMAAILLHSVVDFNLYIPANSLCFAWICGVASSSMWSSRAAAPPVILEVGRRRVG